METKIRHVDVLVIGGGVVGCAILRELSRYDVTIALLERNPDICDGTSKSNSAIIHTGFDAPPGSLEAKLLLEARELWPAVIDSLHIPYLQTGAFMVATDTEELSTIEADIIPKAERNAVILQRHNRPAQATAGRDLIARFQFFQHSLPLLLPPLLRHDQQKVKDGENKDQWGKAQQTCRAAA